MASSPRLIHGFREIAPAYDLIFCDIWGVIHNGHAVFPGVAEALSRFRQAGGTVVLVSNAPRPNGAVTPQLDRLGLPAGLRRHRHLGRRHPRPYRRRRRQARLPSRPERDLPLYDGLDHPLRQGGRGRGGVVCTGLFDDTTETPAIYKPR